MRRPPKKFVPHPFAYHQEIELQIDTLTNLGQGLGRVDGWVVLVPFALPDERVRVSVHRNHKNYSEADLVEVLQASPHRVQPRCPLFGRCGGCQYQNLSYEQQLAWKRQQVHELLRHMAKVEFPVEEVIASPTVFGYRSKITPHFAAPREGSIGEIGFLDHSSRYRIVDVVHCDIAMPQLNEALTETRADVKANAQRYKNGATLLLRASPSQPEVCTKASDLVRQQVGPLMFEFQAGDFFQNNPFLLPAFVQHVTEETAAAGAHYLVDAYCGSGLFGLSAAHLFEELMGIEISESSVLKARHNAALNGIGNARFTAGSAEHIFQDITYSGDQTAVIVDPPRAGCGDSFLDQLLAFGPKTVVYVSCNPATQMRDLTRFVAAGYELKKVQPFDLFPQTRHLECVMTLTKA